jgi:hypothetical protein
VPFDLVLRELRRNNFAVLSTVDPAGKPQSAGVNYGLSPPESPLCIYVMTRTHLAKARNIAAQPSVSLVVPVPRRLLWFVPPATIQIQGSAKILPWTDPKGRSVFRQFWLGRHILRAYRDMQQRGETRVCFLRITPDPVIRTYMVGKGLRQILRHMESGAGATATLAEQP